MYAIVSIVGGLPDYELWSHGWCCDSGVCMGGACDYGTGNFVMFILTFVCQLAVAIFACSIQ
jgi:hypothetical protein